VDPILGDCQYLLYFRHGYFDRIIAIDILRTLTDLPRAIQEMYRLCNKETGFCKVVVPCEDSFVWAFSETTMCGWFTEDSRFRSGPNLCRGLRCP
jgi:ubiquinone/menaquinone biosynthesis C-methylase UbiE